MREDGAGIARLRPYPAPFRDKRRKGMKRIDPADPTLYSLTSAELARFSRGVALGLLKPPRSIERKSDVDIWVRLGSSRQADRARICIC